MPGSNGSVRGENPGVSGSVYARFNVPCPGSCGHPRESAPHRLQPRRAAKRPESGAYKRITNRNTLCYETPPIATDPVSMRAMRSHAPSGMRKIVYALSIHVIRHAPGAPCRLQETVSQPGRRMPEHCSPLRSGCTERNATGRQVEGFLGTRVEGILPARMASGSCRGD